MFSENLVSFLFETKDIVRSKNCNDDRRRVWYMGENSIK
jgi:hypothetical protein